MKNKDSVFVYLLGLHGWADCDVVAHWVVKNYFIFVVQDVLPLYFNHKLFWQLFVGTCMFVYCSYTFYSTNISDLHSVIVHVSPQLLRHK
jgi:hypothetical protein